MNINKIQEQIDKIEYWDVHILDITFSFFGETK